MHLSFRLCVGLDAVIDDQNVIIIYFRGNVGKIKNNTSNHVEEEIDQDQVGQANVRVVMNSQNVYESVPEEPPDLVEDAVQSEDDAHKEGLLAGGADVHEDSLG